MSNDTNANPPSTLPGGGNEPGTGTQPSQGAPDKQPTLEEVIADRDKWKALSRQNEKRWHEASEELSRLKQAQMSDTERAIAQAKEEGRKAALSEVGSRLVEAELQAEAAKAGVKLPPSEFINTSKFLDSNGMPNSEAISQFVSSLPKPVAPEFPQGLGLGRQGGPLEGQLTREDLKNMTPAEINEARKAGKLDALLRGEI